MTREEAERTLADWEQTYQQTAQQTKQTAAVAADKVGKSALWGFFALVIGASSPRSADVGRPRTALVNA